MGFNTRWSRMFSSILWQGMLTQRLQKRPCPSAGEDQHKIALGVDVEVRVPGHIGVQHKLLHLVRLAVKEDIQAPAAQEIKRPRTWTCIAQQTAHLEIGK